MYRRNGRRALEKIRTCGDCGLGVGIIPGFGGCCWPCGGPPGGPPETGGPPGFCEGTKGQNAHTHTQKKVEKKSPIRDSDTRRKFDASLETKHMANVLMALCEWCWETRFSAKKIPSVCKEKFDLT